MIDGDRNRPECNGRFTTAAGMGWQSPEGELFSVGPDVHCSATVATLTEPRVLAPERNNANFDERRQQRVSARNLWVPKTHPSSSGRESVLVDDAAQDVGSSEMFGVDVAGEGRSGVGVGRCALAEGSVRSVEVVVLDVLAEHGFEMTPSEDEYPVEAIAGRCPRIARR